MNQPLAAAHGVADLLVGLVLAQRIHRPDRRWQPADHGDLQDQADDAGERTTDREEGQPRKDQGNKNCLLYTSPSPRDATLSRMPSSA